MPIRQRLKALSQGLEPIGKRLKFEWVAALSKKAREAGHFINKGCYLLQKPPPPHGVLNKQADPCLMQLKLEGIKTKHRQKKDNKN